MNSFMELFMNNLERKMGKVTMNNLELFLNNLERNVGKNGFKIAMKFGIMMALTWLCQILADSSVKISPRMLLLLYALGFVNIVRITIEPICILFMADLPVTNEVIAERVNAVGDYILVITEIIFLGATLLLSIRLNSMIMIPGIYIIYSMWVEELQRKDELREQISRIRSNEEVLSEKSEELVENSTNTGTPKNVEQANTTCDHDEKLLRMNEEIWEYVSTTITTELAEACEENLKRMEEKCDQYLSTTITTELATELAEACEENLKRMEEKCDQYLFTLTSRLEQENEQLLKRNIEKWEGQMREIAAKVEERGENWNLKGMGWADNLTEVVLQSMQENKECLKKMKRNEEEWERRKEESLKKHEEIWERALRGRSSDEEKWVKNMLKIMRQYEEDRKQWEKERGHLMARIEGWNLLETGEQVDGTAN